MCAVVQYDWRHAVKLSHLPVGQWPVLPRAVLNDNVARSTNHAKVEAVVGLFHVYEHAPIASDAENAGSLGHLVAQNEAFDLVLFVIGDRARKCDAPVEGTVDEVATPVRKVRRCEGERSDVLSQARRIRRIQEGLPSFVPFPRAGLVGSTIRPEVSPLVPVRDVEIVVKYLLREKEPAHRSKQREAGHTLGPKVGERAVAKHGARRDGEDRKLPHALGLEHRLEVGSRPADDREVLVWRRHAPSRRADADDLDADSLDLVELVMALEEEFSVTVEEEELEGIDTIQAAFELITSKL